MKKMIFIFFLGALLFGVSAQTTSWSLTGNAGTNIDLGDMQSKLLLKIEELPNCPEKFLGCCIAENRKK